MKTDITMPALSGTLETGRLVCWHKAIGDAVEKGEAIAEVETDKAILDIEAGAEGYLAGPLAAIDTDIPVRQVIGYIVDTRPDPAAPTTAAGSVPGAAPTGGAPPAWAAVDLRLGPPYTLERPRTLRAAVARNMSATLDTPTFLISARFAVGPLQTAAKQAGYSLTLALTRACALTVAEDPWVNHAWTPEGLARRHRVDVGVAVDTGDGLITPVLRDAAARPLKELAETWRALLGKVKKGRVYPEDYRGASFYLSNLGMFAVVERFNAIVPVGASAILAIAAAGSDGRADFTMSCDHRVVFGADAARFLQRLGNRLEDPSWLTASGAPP
ncbi:2-oxo acid dehydrogenase subunit E2 [Acidithiobacillus ferrianus]|uniref:2-oxo acid dehydrogenase subunit E2 n=1 Tax=Acidithiobacillus ferrianus TaxID=2678518 RepID=UPI0034E598BC